MASIKIRPDLFAAFNLTMDTKKPIGYLSTLKISGEEFAPNLSLQNPMKAKEGATAETANTEKVVGVITAIRWDGGFADPITLTCQVNAANKEIAAILQHRGLTNTSCDFSFSVYEYDADKPAYYQSFASKSELNGLIEKNNGMLEMEIDSTPSEEVPSPRNYELYLSIMPKDDRTQQIEVGITSEAKIIKGWGIKAAASTRQKLEHFFPTPPPLA